METLRNFELWRMELDVAMIEGFIDEAADAYPGLRFMLQQMERNVWNAPANRPSGWLLTGEKLALDACRAFCLQQAADFASVQSSAEQHHVPVVRIVLDEEQNSEQVAEQILSFMGFMPHRKLSERQRQRPKLVNGMVQVAAETMKEMGTKLLLIERIDLLQVTPTLGADLSELATGRTLVGFRPHQHPGATIGPFGDTDRATVSALRLWMRHKDLSELDAYEYG